ncbi:urea transporter [Staphylococcus lugdunensis]|uniref:urea transporter n=1 Tax=Staphylococcus lugdunensis TaxID=28035 RepID=UPI00045B9EAF|nr:urea transporter [Staphylococcus lugdunensis]KAK55807.1 urea transporter [Staphylococcus lugdunensis VCU150]MCI2845231.1 urea transporter [Staphylococcus lugdunensis]MDU4770105.1 urea transporter [Staphylococcus lugdunensis]
MEKIDVFLKNIAQVVLINSKWTGLFILIGLFVADWELGLAAVLGSALSVLLAPYFNYSAEEIHNGLAGYNSVLTAIGLALFLQSTTIAWIVLVISVILTLPVGAATREFLKSYGVPMLTFPFVLMTWLILAMTTQFSTLSVTVDILPLHVKHPVISHHHISWLSGITTNFSEIFLVTSIGGSVLILIGIFLGSIKGGVYALISSIFAVACIALLGGDYPTIANGLYGYNAVLTGIALGVTFMTQLNKYIAVITGLLLTIVMHGALATLLTPVGLPILTAPFIFATWLVLFAGKMSNEN